MSSYLHTKPVYAAARLRHRRHTLTHTLPITNQYILIAKRLHEAKTPQTTEEILKLFYAVFASRFLSVARHMIIMVMVSVPLVNAAFLPWPT